ncbi:MAG: citrate/2-methylcitrate synthase, partial [Defluviitaleaceae bacterium]|nr:citrate/2-methylcitrate synthase [Defluviitaleaceae bacterium]
KRGLRDLNGVGVLAGLTRIGDVRSYLEEDGESVPQPGQLFYRGYNVYDLVRGFAQDGRYGFEETAYLLLFGNLPNAQELASFKRILAENRRLPAEFVRDDIMQAPSANVMNSLSRSVLTLYTFDENPDDTSVENLLRQCLKLISTFSMLSVYSYRIYAHYFKHKSLVIRDPDPDLSTAENILYMLKPDTSYTELEARLLDLALVLHAEHGGGNNSTFVTHVVSSSGTDAYSTIAAALGSLKGPRHGGANIKVVGMFEDIKKNVGDWADDDEIAAYLAKMLNKQAFDHSGLIYGIGHAVYSMSDPRAVILKARAEALAKEKGMTAEMNLYLSVERIAPQVISKQRKMYKGVSANVDYYSGFVYKMLGFPEELFTPIFAVARIVGWSAHLMEEIVNNGKIIRPAYKSVSEEREYVPLGDR